jgi:imidazole glycerol-phosphate synthase subunit HisH
MIGILKIGYGNIQSIKAIIDRLGYDFVEVDQGTDFSNLTHLIIPGTGNYAKASEMLISTGLDRKIKKFIAKKPVLGICVGMQIMTAIGYETATSKGLGLFEGDTRLLPIGESSVLPHMGWNSVNFTQSHPVFKNIKNDVDFYFVHSYCVANIDKNFVYGETSYGSPFTSIIAKENVVGTQFHPEKSLKNGVRLLDNFCAWDGRC